jgi:uncharacterized membrane protein
LKSIDGSTQQRYYALVVGMILHHAVSSPLPSQIPQGSKNLEDAMKSTVVSTLLFLVAIPFATAQTYTVTDLGAIAPTSINIWGQVVGNSTPNAFVWTKGLGLKNLGTLSGGTSTYAASISDFGVVTGYADGAGTVISPDPLIPNQQCSDLTQPFLWTSGEGLQGLGTIGVPPYTILYQSWCGIEFYATGTNIRGQVVGYTTLYSNETQYAFLRTPAGVWSLFGNSFPPSLANAVSDTGEIIGQNGSFIGEGTWWKGGMATTLSSLVGNAGSANAVNDAQEIAGWSATTPLGECMNDLDACTLHAVLWKRDGTIDDLGTLPGDNISSASGINLFGRVVGVSGNTLVGQGWGGNGGTGFGGLGGSIAVVGRPFVWSNPKGMQDLNTLIPPGSGWVLNSASAINFWGQIVGSGTLNGESHGFLLTPQ